MLLPRKKDDSLKKHLALEEELLNLFTHEELNIEELMKTVTKIRDLSGWNTSLIQPEIIKEKEFSESTLQLYEKAKTELENVYNEDVPVLNLHTFKDFLENFSTLTDNSFVLPDKTFPNIIVTDKTENLNLRFKNGNKIILTNKCFDFSQFSKEELIEILHFLETKIKDSSYDYLRTEITKYIGK